MKLEAINDNVVIKLEKEESKEEKESARADPAPQRFSGHDRASGGEIQHRSLHPRQPISHGDDTEKLPTHDG